MPKWADDSGQVGSDLVKQKHKREQKGGVFAEQMHMDTSSLFFPGDCLWACNCWWHIQWRWDLASKEMAQVLWHPCHFRYRFTSAFNNNKHSCIWKTGQTLNSSSSYGKYMTIRRLQSRKPSPCTEDPETPKERADALDSIHIQNI